MEARRAQMYQYELIAVGLWHHIGWARSRGRGAICTASARTVLTQTWDADALSRGRWLGVKDKAHGVRDRDARKGERGDNG